MGKISCFQFFTLLTLSRLLTTLTFVPSFSFEVGVSDCVVATLIGTVLLWLTCLPVHYFLNHNDSKRLTCTTGKSRALLTFLYCIYFFFLINFTLLRLKLFVSSVFFPSISTALFTVITVAALCYCASFTLEAVARAGSIAFVLLLVSLSAIFLALGDNISLNKLSPVFYYGASPVLKIALSVLARSSEPVIIYMLADRVNGNIKKGLLVWLSTTTVLVTVSVLLLMMSLSDSALLQAFPFHAMAELSSLGVIERMDSVLTGIWIMSAFIKAVLMAVILKDLLSGQIPKLKQKHILSALAVLLIGSLLTEEKSLIITGEVSSFLIRAILFSMFVLIIPCFVLTVNRFKKRKTQ